MSSGAVYMREYNVKNRARLRAYQRDYRHARPGGRKVEKKKYLQKNREKVNALGRRYRREKYKNSVNFKIASCLRSRLASAIRKKFKSGSAVRDLGCSIDEFKKYISDKFQVGMSWDNYGQDTWHLDHIIPLCAFDLTDRDQLMAACHYTNLQPLWARDNLQKGRKIA